MGLVALRAGDLAGGRSLLEESLALLDKYDDHWTRAVALTFLGLLELAAGESGRAEALLGQSAALQRSIDNPTLLPWCLEGLAGVAAARGRWGGAARLCGAHDALRARLGWDLPPAHADGYAATLTSIRAVLGEESFAAAHASGAAMTLEAALDDGTGA